MSPLEALWYELNLQFDAALNTSLIADPVVSYIAVTGVRVLLIGLCALAARRVGQLIQDLPARKKSESFRTYIHTPWWRLPALLMTTGLVGMALMFFLQLFAGNLQPEVNRVGNLTPYLLLANLFLGTSVLGVALGAGAWRRQIRRSPSPRLVMA